MLHFGLCGGYRLGRNLETKFTKLAKEFRPHLGEMAGSDDEMGGSGSGGGAGSGSDSDLVIEEEGDTSHGAGARAGAGGSARQSGSAPKV